MIMLSLLKKLTPVILFCLLPEAQSTIIAPNALNLRLTANLSHAIPPTLYGYMWEVR